MGGNAKSKESDGFPCASSWCSSDEEPSCSKAGRLYVATKASILIDRQRRGATLGVNAMIWRQRKGFKG